jgi:hypothetical protein
MPDKILTWIDDNSSVLLVIFIILCAIGGGIYVWYYTSHHCHNGRYLYTQTTCSTVKGITSCYSYPVYETICDGDKASPTATLDPRR